MVVHVDGVRLCLRASATKRIIVHPSDDEYEDIWRNDTARENRVNRRIICASDTLSTTNTMEQSELDPEPARRETGD
jgi:hypothetical protein